MSKLFKMLSTEDIELIETPTTPVEEIENGVNDLQNTEEIATLENEIDNAEAVQTDTEEVIQDLKEADEKAAAALGEETDSESDAATTDAPVDPTQAAVAATEAIKYAAKRLGLDHSEISHVSQEAISTNTTTVLKLAREDIKDMIGKAKDGLKSLWEKIKAFFLKLYEALKALFGNQKAKLNQFLAVVNKMEDKKFGKKMEAGENELAKVLFDGKGSDKVGDVIKVYIDDISKTIALASKANTFVTNGEFDNSKLDSANKASDGVKDIESSYYKGLTDFITKEKVVPIAFNRRNGKLFFRKEDNNYGNEIFDITNGAYSTLASKFKSSKPVTPAKGEMVNYIKELLGLLGDFSKAEQVVKNNMKNVEDLVNKTEDAEKTRKLISGSKAVLGILASVAGADIKTVFKIIGFTIGQIGKAKTEEEKKAEEAPAEANEAKAE